MSAVEAPFATNGDLLHSVRWSRGVEWREVAPFKATLVYDGYERGRSAMTFYWRDENGLRYPMFLSDFDKMMKDSIIGFGRVWGIWQVVRRSGYFGIVHTLPEVSE